MRNAYKILGVKLEISICGDANIAADLFQETGYKYSGQIRLAEDGYYSLVFDFGGKFDDEETNCQRLRKGVILICCCSLPHLMVYVYLIYYYVHPIILHLFHPIVFSFSSQYLPSLFNDLYVYICLCLMEQIQIKYI